MKRLSVVLITCLVAAGCTYRPAAVDLVRIVDTPADLRICKRLGDVSGPISTSRSFGGFTTAMLEQTVALGGTDLLLEPLHADWSVVRGVAYRCPVNGESNW